MHSDPNSPVPVPATPLFRPVPNGARPGVSVAGLPEEAPGLSLGDIYFTLFRQKWRIVACAFVGLVAAALLFKFRPPPFQSDAKLFIRYVMETRATGPVGDTTRVKSLDSQGETIIGSELEIMTSLDLLAHVVDAVGPTRIVPPSSEGNERNRALGYVSRNLIADVAPGSRVMHLTFKHKDPAVAQAVLRQVIDQYLKKHLEVHRALGMTGDYLTQETDQLRARLSQTEDELRTLHRKVGVVSVADAKKSAAEQMARLRQEIFAAEAELAERSALLQPATSAPATASNVAPAVAPVPPPAVLDEYRQLDSRIATLRKREQELLVLFTQGSGRVQEVRTQLKDALIAKKQLEADHPGLLTVETVRTLAEVSTGPIEAPRWVKDAAQLRAVESKIKVLQGQLEGVRTEIANLEQLEGTIQELQRKKDLEEANYRYYSASLEQSRIDEALGAGHVSNISEIQSPSPPVRNWPKAQKMLLGVAAGGLLLGLAWAFVIEHFFDRTVKRPIDIERAVKLPLFLSIPDLGRRRKDPSTHGARLPPPATSRAGSPAKPAERSEVEPWHPNHALYPFHETLRDRLIAYFESIGLTHKPKLVALTGLSKGAGVTTIAAGLAQRLSETGEGNVLLVDMTAGQGSAQQFFKGEAVRNLDELLDRRDSVPAAQDKLYVVTEAGPHEQLSRNLPQRFSKLVPKLKASDFDYIILDMPPVNQISVTPRLASFMDMVLLVVEAEKVDRDVVQRATALLSASKARLGTVLNRVHSYIPRRLYQDSMGDL